MEMIYIGNCPVCNHFPAQFVEGGKVLHRVKDADGNFTGDVQCGAPEITNPDLEKKL